ncbi:VTT domain-containing protein [Streptomyces sp. NPDC006335]|uniref:DedA family protein n=1 Tax=Streptomyces sp. NPDC006335 TaxID=3156895 RepID=UPI0033BAC2CE
MCCCRGRRRSCWARCSPAGPCGGRGGAAHRAGRCRPRQPGRIRGRTALKGPGADTAPGTGGPTPVHRAGPRALEPQGAGAVFVGRCTAVPRTLMPTLCGALRMPLRPYLLWSGVSSAVWAPAFVLIGYVVGPAGPG